MKVLLPLLAAIISLATARPNLPSCIPPHESENKPYMQFRFQKRKHNCTEGQAKGCNYIEVTRYWTQLWNPLAEDLDDGGWGTGYWEIEEFTGGKKQTKNLKRPPGWDPQEIMPKGDWGRVNKSDASCGLAEVLAPLRYGPVQFSKGPFDLLCALGHDFEPGVNVEY
ncbi:hypothetical protein CDD80_2518 [Ophiocordyceps camponoti-rufipedis]|uniref:Uncharacterized protein n=1 Tax=Ophiocordyceps camponoti-rufipedis TaxID=2004952 RepID=A0A2C5XK63_9HYPO|nr:hypothetical protein CDD80_2518 [Ophiocordyceps camponoti-rufipedis]